MHKLTTSLLALTLAAPAMAQGFTSPPGYLSTEGGTWQNIATTSGYAYYMGYYADMHYQQLDREIKAGGLAVLTSVGYRLDGRTHSTSTAMGRKFNATLELSDGNFDTATTNFANNQTSTPTMVFSGTVSWPSQVGAPGSSPAPWDPALAFPFGTGGGASSYIYAATADLCLDFKLNGGVLANGDTGWTGTSGRTYYLDSLYVLTSTTYGRNVYKYIGASTGDCVDSARTTGYASGSIQVGLYGKGYTSNPAYAGKAVMQIFGSNTAPNSNVIHAVGLGGTTPGVAVPGFGCYNMMIDTTLFIGVYNIATNSSGSRTWLYVPIADLSVLAPLGSTTPIWSQAIWNDSATGQVKLTTGERCTADYSRKFNTSSPMRKVVYRYDTTSATGSGPYDYFYMNPIAHFQ